MAHRTRKRPGPTRGVRKELTKAVLKACQKEHVPCTNQNALLVVRVATSTVAATQSLEGSDKGRWFCLPNTTSAALDRVLPVVFTQGVNLPNSDSLHATFNQELCSGMPTERGLQVRKQDANWQIRIVSDDQSLAPVMPRYLDVR